MDIFLYQGDAVYRGIKIVTNDIVPKRLTISEQVYAKPLSTPVMLGDHRTVEVVPGFNNCVAADHGNGARNRNAGVFEG